MKETMAVIWDSRFESDPIYPITDDDFYIAIDEENGVLRLSDYYATSGDLTTMLFVGPAAAENAAKFDAYVRSGGNEHELNTETDVVIRKCFGLPS